MARRKKQADVVEDFVALDPQGDGDAGTNAQEPSVKDLLTQIQSLTTRVETAERTNAALMSAPPVTVTQKGPPQFKQPEFKNLPDPSIDPEGYAAAVHTQVAKQVQDYVKETSDYQANQVDPSDQARELWNKFTTSYKEYAGNQDQVEFAASKVAQEARAKGLDPQKYMFGPGQDYFLRDVKDMVVKVFGDPTKKTEDDEDDGGEDNGNDISRSMSIFGGLESAGRPGKKTNDVAEKGDMIKEIQEIQRKTGFH